MKKASYIALAGVVAIAGMAPIVTEAQTLGGILKGGAIAVLVSNMGGSIDKAINKVTGTRKTAVNHTKVVPIISAGQGAYVGAVQVMGSKSRVDRVKAVAQLEGRAGDVRFRALIPVSTLNPTKSPSRVLGVGVSGLVDVNL